MAEDQQAKQRHSVELPTERQTASDAAKAILSVILFHRLFGTLTPQTSDALGVTYPRASNVEAEALVADKARELGRALRSNDRASLVVEFFERKAKRNAWFAKTYDTCWETWRVDFLAIAAPQKPQLSSKQLQQALFEVLSAMDANKDHIPPITTTDATPFPYKISVE